MPHLFSSYPAKLLYCSTLLAVSQWSLAGGPDLPSTPVNPLTGFEMGIQGLVGVGITNTRTQFNASNTTQGIIVTTAYSTSNAVLTANAITAGGGSIGYNIPWGNTFAIEPLFGFNTFYGKIKSQWTIPGLFGTDTTLTTQNTVTLKNQYNLLVNLKKLISSNVALTLGLGASYMQFDNNLAVIPTNSRTNAVPNNRNNGAHGIGPIIGVGAQWLLGHHSSVAVNLDNYMYIEKNLGTIRNIDPVLYSDYSTLKNRKITLFLPVLSMQYNINFCV